MRLAANLALVALIAGLLAIASTVTVIPALTGTIPVSVTAGSMTPTYPFGTLVLIDPDRQPAIGDVITLRHGQATPVTHRVMAIEPDYSGNHPQYITRGDNNITDDAEPALEAEVVGTVTHYIPFVGLALGLLDKTPVLVFLGSIALLLYMASNHRPDSHPVGGGLSAGV